jgi:hypothetical protein
MQNQRMPKQIAEAAVEGVRKRGRPCKRWRYELEEDLSVVEIKKKKTGNGQRPSRMGGDCVGSRGPQRTVTLEEKKRQKNA